MITISTIERWGVAMNGFNHFLPVTTVEQIDRFILPRGYHNNFDHNYDREIGARRIRDLGSDELDWLLHCIENPGESPPPNSQLSILYDWKVYHTYAELAEAMGVPEFNTNRPSWLPMMVHMGFTNSHGSLGIHSQCKTTAHHVVDQCEHLHGSL
jgi:hypothetical protein